MGVKGISKVAPIGKSFGKVIVISESINMGSYSAVQGRCECGDVRQYPIANLRAQKCPMCPDCRTQSRPAKGASRGHPLFNIWKGMIQRCENPKHTWYKRYGGRGISICPEWRNDFYAFAAYMGERPTPEHTVDRIDSDGNYEPRNVRWLTIGDQQNNRGNSVRVEYLGKPITIKEICELTGLQHAAVAWRINQGWPIEKVMAPERQSRWNKF